MAYKKIKMEAGSPFNSMDWIVAKDEGLFEKEGLDVEFIKHGIHRETDLSLTNAWNQVSSALGHAEAVERGDANFFNGCEWGNYRRAQDSKFGSRTLGRRACVPVGAIVVPPWSDIYTPQQLANRPIAVPYYQGTHYLALMLLEGFLPRDMIKAVHSGEKVVRYRSMMDGTTDACTVSEPWNTVADKAGCRTIAQAFLYGTDVGTTDIDAETYAAINRALSEAVRRLNADKKKYVHYFIDYDPAEEVQALTEADFNLNRLVYIEPGTPIPEDEFQRTYEWMVSWDLIGAGHSAEDLINTEIAALASD